MPFAAFETETVKIEGQMAWFLIPSYFRTGGGFDLPAPPVGHILSEGNAVQINAGIVPGLIGKPDGVPARR